jgi:integrase
MPRPSKPWFKSHRNTWYVTVGGHKVSLGVRGKKNRQAAYAAWHRLLADGRPVTGDPAGTVADVVTAFLADATGRVKPATLAWYHKFLDPFAATHGGVKAASLTPTLVESFSRRPSWSLSTRHDCIGAIQAAFRWAVRDRRLPNNPIGGVRRPKKASRGAKCLVTPDQFARLRAAAHPSLRDLIDVLHTTGCRPGEAARVTAADVDWAARIVTLNDHKTADVTGRPRAIVLTEATAELLRRLATRYPSGPLLRNAAGRPWTRKTWVEAIRRLRERVGVPAFTAYSLRHGFITDSLASGLNDSLVAELVGHSGTAMLRNYAHLAARQQALREALSRVR